MEIWTNRQANPVAAVYSVTQSLLTSSFKAYTSSTLVAKAAERNFAYQRLQIAARENYEKSDLWNLETLKCVEMAASLGVNLCTV